SLIRASERSPPMMLAPNSRASSAAVSPLPQPTSSTRRFFSSPPSDRRCLVRSVPPGRRDLYSLGYSIFLPLSHSHTFLGTSLFNIFNSSSEIQLGMLPDFTAFTHSI